MKGIPPIHAGHWEPENEMSQYRRKALKLVKRHRDSIEAVAKRLLEVDTLTGDDVLEVMLKVKFGRGFRVVEQVVPVERPAKE